ncbi:tyrosine-type recombinase/integrase [Bdellovibrio sp. HCB337]|uniref:tyrosine-type recombinase/integrase n=1 Tax=Bdellovibrio sp. HCB337 TaxID=3394358 RepID=UPI0039A66CC7
MAALKLLESIDKYLKFMDFVKSSSPLTLKAYKKDLEQAFGSLDPQGQAKKAFTEAEILSMSRDALNSWAGLSLSSRNRKSSTLKSFFSWAYQEKLTERDLSTQIISPKVPKKLPHFLSVDEALAVLSSYDKKDTSIQNIRDKTMFLVLYGAGLRVSEACNLKWTDVHFSTRSLRLKGKGGKERLVILPTLAIEVLQKLRSLSDEDYVFGVEPLNPRVAYDWVRTRGAKALLMKPLHPHALRHSFATHLLSSGANLRTLQELLGHESLQATEKYTHLGVDQLARTMENHHPLSKGSQKKPSKR